MLTLFDDGKTAAGAFATLLDTSDKGGLLTVGPQVGDDHRYFTRITKDKRTPYETTLRFRVGPVVGRLSTFNQLGHDKPEALARYAAPVTQKIQFLLDGRLRAAPLLEEFAARMPPALAAPGPVLGSTVIPVESWALADTSAKPAGVRDRLLKLGVTKLGFRRYGLSADRSQVIEVTLFAFADDRAAADWVQTFIALARKQGTLDGGKTGELAAFTNNAGDFYELQFAQGRFVGDVSCFAPYAKTSSACEAPVRRLAELWLAALMR